MGSRKRTDIKLLLAGIDIEKYPDKAVDLLKIISFFNDKICYVCLSKPYADVIKDMKKMEMAIDKFFFIDVLTRHYRKPEPADNCTFINSPENIEEIKEAIEKAVREQKCEKIFIDTISSLLSYHEGSEIIRLANELRNGAIGKLKNLKQTVIVALSEEKMLSESYSCLLKDLSMFADEIEYHEKKTLNCKEVMK